MGFVLKKKNNDNEDNNENEVLDKKLLSLVDEFFVEFADMDEEKEEHMNMLLEKALKLEAEGHRQ